MTNQKAFPRVRSLFPHAPKTVYFNSASYGPFAKPVVQAIEDNLSLRMSANHDDSHDAFAAADELRGTYARLIGARKQDVGLGLNTTHGLNIAAFGLPLKHGDEILVSDIEFPAITSDLTPKHRSSIFTFTCKNYRTLHKNILKSGIVLAEREGSIRVSIHLFNNKTDINRLIRVLEQFAKAS